MATFTKEETWRAVRLAFEQEWPEVKEEGGRVLPSAGWGMQWGKEKQRQASWVWPGPPGKGSCSQCPGPCQGALASGDMA